jgi:hypothetical protein
MKPREDPTQNHHGMQGDLLDTISRLIEESQFHSQGLEFAGRLECVLAGQGLA